MKDKYTIYKHFKGVAMVQWSIIGLSTNRSHYNSKHSVDVNRYKKSSSQSNLRGSRNYKTMKYFNTSARGPHGVSHVYVYEKIQ